MILEQQSFYSQSEISNSFVTNKQLLKLLNNNEDFKDELIKLFNIDKNNIQVFEIGNSKQLLDSLTLLDSKCKKIDIISEVKNIQLKKILENEIAIFELFDINDTNIIKNIKSDKLTVETRYSAKAEILDYYHLNKFANYCRDSKYSDLLLIIKDYLKEKNVSNKHLKKLRLVYKYEDKKYYLRALVSTNDYKDFGINFSVFVAIATLHKYLKKSKNSIYISSYTVNDSNLYIVFTLKNIIPINSKMSLSFNLILENDEIKREAVSFNGVFKLIYKENNQSTEIFLKPKGIQKEHLHQPTDLLTYLHRGSIEAVFEKIKELPILIDMYIKQVTEDTKRISSIQNPNDIKKLISNKIKNAKKQEFLKYKKLVFEKLMKNNIDNTFKLFDLLREVEELFEHEDIISIDFWRTKLYEALIEKK